MTKDVLKMASKGELNRKSCDAVCMGGVKAGA